MLVLRQISLAEANGFTGEFHRHCNTVQGHKWSLGAYAGETLVGVAIVGRPYDRWSNTDEVVCVLRCTTNGYRNACSFLYGACARVAKQDGYKKIITYTLQSEPGTSLKAAGWTIESPMCGGNGKWTGKRQKERDAAPKQLTLFPQKEPPKEYKVRWAKSFQ